MLNAQQQEIADRMDAIQLHIALNPLDEPDQIPRDQPVNHSYVLWNNKGGVGMKDIFLFDYFIF